MHIKCGYKLLKLVAQYIEWFLARDVIYTSRAYATIQCPSVCPSICDGSALAHYS